MPDDETLAQAMLNNDEIPEGGGWVPEPDEVVTEPDETPGEVVVAPEETPAELQQTASEVNATPEETPPPEEPLPPIDYKPQLPVNLYTPEEQAWLERVQDDMDTKVRLQAQQFMINKSQEYHAKANLVAQAQMATIPQPIMAIHGPMIAEYLNAMVQPERRGTPEALEEARAWSLMKRSTQIGHEKAYEEALNAMRGQRQVPVSVAPPKPPPAPKPVIAAENRVPTGGTGLSPGTGTARTADRVKDRFEKAFGIPYD